MNKVGSRQSTKLDTDWYDEEARRRTVYLFTGLHNLWARNVFLGTADIIRMTLKKILHCISYGQRTCETLRNEFQERREPVVNATSRNSIFSEIPAMNGHFWNRTGLVRREFGDKLSHKCRLSARSKWSRVVTVVNHLWCQFSFIWSIFNFNRAHKIDLKIHFLITWLHSINHFSALWNNWKTTKQARSRVTMNWSIN